MIKLHFTPCFLLFNEKGAFFPSLWGYSGALTIYIKMFFYKIWCTFINWAYKKKLLIKFSKKNFFFEIFFETLCFDFLTKIFDLWKKNFFSKKIYFITWNIFSNAECVKSGHWNDTILFKMQILFCILEDTCM